MARYMIQESCWGQQPQAQAGLSAVHSLPTAVLAAGAPEVAAFMSEEAVAAVAGLPALQYTVKHYLLYLSRVQERATALSQGAETTGGRGGHGELSLTVGRSVSPSPRLSLPFSRQCIWAVDPTPRGDGPVDLGCRAEDVPGPAAQPGSQPGPR